MASRIQKHSNQTASRRAFRGLTVCVVDPQTGEYQPWLGAAQASGVRLEFRPDAAAALRLAREQQVDLWVINAELPGLSGAELCTMLKSQGNGAAVYLAAEVYSAELEQAAWRARATMFGVKPAHADWLSSWLSQQHVPRRSAGRDGARLRC